MRIADREISAEQLADFCQRWRLRRLSLFGSAATGTMGADSDVDFLGEYEEPTALSLLDEVQLVEELALLVGREVDFVTENAVRASRNSIRRAAILEGALRVYERT